MSLDKKQQKQLFNWLKQKTRSQQSTLRVSILLGSTIGLLIIAQAWILACLLQLMIIYQRPLSALLPYLTAFLVCLLLRSGTIYLREQVNFKLGVAIRHTIRQQILDKLQQLGPTYLAQKSAGDWSTLLIEQIEDIQDFYSRYLPQMRLAMMVPLFILLALVLVNWAAALILLITAPLIPLFMILVGMGAADVNRRNFQALAHLSGHFLDRLKSLNTIRLFNQQQAQTAAIQTAAESFRKRTMEVLRMAFLSSAVLEFFASISIALVAVYFGFSYLGAVDFGHYSTSVTLFAGFFALILAPEFFQPLRDLGTFYHAKAQAIAAAENLQQFLDQPLTTNSEQLARETEFLAPLQSIVASDLVILAADQQVIAGPINFRLSQGQKIALIGKSGAGKTSLINVLLGFLPYQGSLTINGVELRELNLNHWRSQLSWLGQNPHLPAATLRENILLGNPTASPETLTTVLAQSHVDEFIARLPQGLDTQLGDDATRLSLGQAQRVALARAILKPHQLLLLDEPTASLDQQTTHWINQAISEVTQDKTVLTVTHHTTHLQQYDQIWQFADGQFRVIKEAP